MANKNINAYQKTDGEKLYKYTYKVGNKVIHRGVTDNEGRKDIEKMEKWGHGYLYPTGREIVRAKLVWGGELEKSLSK